MTDERPLTAADYEDLLASRTSLRKFLSWSETRAREAGLAPAQHQLLLAIKGHSGGRPGDGRVIRIRLTPVGGERLSRLSTAHLSELRHSPRSWTT